MVAIKDMEMPKTCNDCNFNFKNSFVISSNFCKVLNRPVYVAAMKERAKDCPLVPLVEISNEEINNE